MRNLYDRLVLYHPRFTIKMVVINEAKSFLVDFWHEVNAQSDMQYVHKGDAVRGIARYTRVHHLYACV